MTPAEHFVRRYEAAKELEKMGFITVTEEPLNNRYTVAYTLFLDKLVESGRITKEMNPDTILRVIDRFNNASVYLDQVQ